MFYEILSSSWQDQARNSQIYCSMLALGLMKKLLFVNNCWTLRPIQYLCIFNIWIMTETFWMNSQTNVCLVKLWCDCYMLRQKLSAAKLETKVFWSDMKIQHSVAPLRLDRFVMLECACRKTQILIAYCFLTNRELTRNFNGIFW